MAIVKGTIFVAPLSTFSLNSEVNCTKKKPTGKLTGTLKSLLGKTQVKITSATPVSLTTTKTPAHVVATFINVNVRNFTTGFSSKHCTATLTATATGVPGQFVGRLDVFCPLAPPFTVQGIFAGTIKVKKSTSCHK